MVATRRSQESARQRYAWGMLFVLSLALVVNILFVAAFESGPETFVQDTTPHGMP